MTTFETAGSSTTRAPEALVLPRRHIIAIAILLCVPLPLLSLAAMIVPLPRIVERAAATFISVAAPVVGTNDKLIREKTVAVRSVQITYRRSELRANSDVRTSRVQTPGPAGRSSKAGENRAAHPDGTNSGLPAVSTTREPGKPTALRLKSETSRDSATAAKQLKTRGQSAQGAGRPRVRSKRRKGGDSSNGNSEAGRSGGVASGHRGSGANARKASGKNGGGSGKSRAERQSPPPGEKSPPANSGNTAPGGGNGQLHGGPSGHGGGKP